MNKCMNDMHGIILKIAQSLPGFLSAIVVHEAAHAWTANRFGDATAKNEGRVTLNPAAHYDMWGTIIFPLFAAVSGWAMIGWARPVPVNVRNFKNIRSGMFWVSFAGPLSNILLGTLSAIVMAIIYTQFYDWSYANIFVRMLQFSVMINFILAFFNLIPLPPLDGSKMVASFLKGPTLYKYESLARFTPVIFMGVLLLSFMGVRTLGYLLGPAISISELLMVNFVSFFSA